MKKLLSILLAITLLVNAFALYSFAEDEKSLYKFTITGTADYLKSYEAFDLINAYRAEKGLPSFKADKEFMDSAMQRAAEIAVLYSSARPNDIKNEDSFQSAYPEALQNGCYEFETVRNSNDAEEFAKNVQEKSFMTATNYKTLAVGCVYHNGFYYWIVACAVAEGTPESDRTLTKETTVFEIEAEKDALSKAVTEPEELTLEPSQKDSVLFEFENYGYNQLKYIINPAKIENSDEKVLKAEIDSNAVRVEALADGKAEIKLLVESINGGETIESTISATVKTPAPDVMLGDITGDGKISVVDAKWMLQILAKTRHISIEQSLAADLNDDGKLSVVDAKWTLQIVAGLRNPETMELIKK